MSDTGSEESRISDPEGNLKAQIPPFLQQNFGGARGIDRLGAGSQRLCPPHSRQHPASSTPGFESLPTAIFLPRGGRHCSRSAT